MMSIWEYEDYARPVFGPRSLLLQVALGGVAAVSIPPFNFAAFLLWGAFLVLSVRKQLRRRRFALATALFTTHVAFFAGIVTAAYLAPGKTTDRFLDRRITLPKSSMTLAELEGDPDGPRPFWRLSSVRILAPDDEKTKLIAFPEATLTLRQFVRAIESQSTLRRRFHHCGNGWTVLRGGDCSFGLSLRDPRDWPN